MMFFKALGKRAIQVGGFISMPYLDANLTSLCDCSLLNGAGFTLVLAISNPTSKSWG
jgi:hypothetical protein